jgi:hypothetical protein
MSVYVDDMEAPFGRMKMCHCWADTRAELFIMMERIGVQLKWFQRPPGVSDFGMDASWEHFDIALSKRALAVKYGAIEVDMFTMSEHADRQKFLAAVAQQHWRRAAHALRMMCLANATKRKHYP